MGKESKLPQPYQQDEPSHFAAELHQEIVDVVEAYLKTHPQTHNRDIIAALESTIQVYSTVEIFARMAVQCMNRDELSVIIGEARQQLSEDEYEEFLIRTVYLATALEMQVTMILRWPPDLPDSADFQLPPDPGWPPVPE